MNLRSILASLVWFSLAPAAASGAESWSQWGGPQRNFQVEDVGLADRWPEAGPDVLWRRQLGDGYSGIVYAAETLYTLYRAGDSEILAAIDAGTGSINWKITWSASPKEFMDTEFGPGPHSTPLIVGDRVFAVGATGRMVAVDRARGELLWDRELWGELGGTALERGYAASPLAFRDLVIVPVGGEGRAIMAFEQKDGSIAWQAGDHEIAYASPILIQSGGREQLVALLKEEIVGLDPASGRPLWLMPVSDERFVNVATPLFFADDLLFFDSSEGARVLRLEEVDGQTRPRELWLAKVIGSQLGNVIRQGDHLYGTMGRTAASFFTAISLSTGEIAWRSREIGDCTLLTAGDKVLALGGDGTLRTVDLSPSGLSIVSETQVFSSRSWTAPTLVGTTLYLRDRQEIVAVDLAPRAD